MPVAIDLKGRTILVCGVSRGGIGGATARQIAAAGATVIAVDYTQDIVDETVADIKKADGTCHGMVVDLMDPAKSDPLVGELLQRFGSLDGVANVAGGDLDKWLPLEETPTSVFREVLNLNLEYVFRICRDAAASMIKRNVPGSLVNVGSVSALTSAPFHGPYGAGKAGIAALTRTMAYEWGRYGIRANTVSPGAVMTERNRNRSNIRPDAEGNTVRSDIVWTSVDELAQVILFLLSDLASGVSGQTIVVDSALSTKFCCGSTRPFEVRKAEQRIS